MFAKISVRSRIKNTKVINSQITLLDALIQYQVSKNNNSANNMAAAYVLKLSIKINGRKWGF